MAETRRCQNLSVTFQNLVPSQPCIQICTRKPMFLLGRKHADIQIFQNVTQRIPKNGRWSAFQEKNNDKPFIQTCKTTNGQKIRLFHYDTFNNNLDTHYRNYLNDGAVGTYHWSAFVFVVDFVFFKFKRIKEFVTVKFETNLI